MARVKTDWSVEGPATDSRGRPAREIVAAGSTTGDVSERTREMLLRTYSGAEFVITVTVNADTRTYFRHVDGQP